MRIAALALLLAPSIAFARPVTLGVSAGVHQDEIDQDDEGNRTLGLFGRFGMSKRIAGQLEVQKIDTDAATYEPTKIRTVTALLVVDLVDSGRWIPTLKVGAGLDWASTEWETREGHHFEGGFGLEYRADDGVTIGLDLRMGGRSVDEPEYVINDDVARPLVYDGGGLREGEYRSGRVYVGIQF